MSDRKKFKFKKTYHKHTEEIIANFNEISDAGELFICGKKLKQTNADLN